MRGGVAVEYFSEAGRGRWGDPQGGRVSRRCRPRGVSAEAQHPREGADDVYLEASAADAATPCCSLVVGSVMACRTVREGIFTNAAWEYLSHRRFPSVPAAHGIIPWRADHLVDRFGRPGRAAAAARSARRLVHVRAGRDRQGGSGREPSKWHRPWLRAWFQPGGVGRGFGGEPTSSGGRSSTLLVLVAPWGSPGSAPSCRCGRRCAW